MIPALVVPLSALLEKQKHTEEVFLEPLGLALARGSVSEIIGPMSSGKSSLVLSVLAHLTQRGEICAMVDACNGFNPYVAVSIGVTLENLLWSKGDGSIVNAFKAASFLAQAKGFGAIWLNLNGFESLTLRKIPNSYWYHFKNLVKDTSTLFLVTAEEVVVGSATTRSYLMTRFRSRWSGKGSFKLLREFHLGFASRKIPREPQNFNFELAYDDA
jgi:hypothetical protein